MAVVIRRPVSKNDKLIALGIINDVNKEMESHGEPKKMKNIEEAYTEYLWLSHMKHKMDRAAILLGFTNHQELKQYMDMGFDLFED